MPITAYSNTARRELDVEQWLGFNSYDVNADPNWVLMSAALREKAAVDIECSCCGARGATLVRGARSKGTGKSVAQPHFRFSSPDDSNPHNPLCDFYDEQKVRGTDYLANFANAKSELTKAIRELVCRGISSGLFSQADMRAMRQWFLQEKATHNVRLDVSAELLQWCVDMDTARPAWDGLDLPFIPEYGLLPKFDWKLAARREWARRNEHLFAAFERRVHFTTQTVERPLRLLKLHAGEPVLDPSALRDKYSAAVTLARFVAKYLFDVGPAPSAILHKHHFSWGATGHALLALSALLLFKSNWDLAEATALYCRLKAVDAVSNGLEGNLIGLNPFHDYYAWEIIDSARRIAANRIDARPVSAQLDEVQNELQARYRDQR